ncbi:MAG: class I adenylate-forming enzyme family protein [Myxococcota bacterium]
MTQNPPPPIDAREAQVRLTAPGAPFEIVEEDVLGERLPVYKARVRSLRELLQRSAAHGDTTYFVFDDGRRVTYAEHLRVVASVAAALRDRYGVGKGDRVAILAANCPEWIVTYWAATSLGAIAVGMNGWWAADEIAYGIELSEPKVLVADERRLARLEGRDPGVPTVVVERDFAALWNHDPQASLPDVAIAEDDPAVILFTSGTTGRPKAAVLSHRSIVAFVMTSFFLGARRAMTEPSGGKPGASLAVYPLFHVSGMFGSTTTGLAAGTTSVWPTGRFDARKVIELSKQHDITAWTGAATHIFRLLDAVDDPSVEFDTGVLSSIGIGGSATTPELIRRTEERVPQLRGTFGSGYGSTETGALVSYANNAMLKADPTCVGPLLPTVAVRILDDEGKDVAEGVDGHIYVRSPLVMLGYWRNDEANRKTLRPGRWLDTGDFGHLVGDVLHLASRKRDLILRGGENVYPAEIENRLESHPDVAEVAVVGVDHVELGQEVKAIVVPRAGARPDPEALRAFVAEKLAYYKVPQYVELRSEPLPRNATGKVMKHVLTGEAENTFVEE